MCYTKYYMEGSASAQAHPATTTTTMLLERVTGRCSDKTSGGIAHAIAGLIRQGELRGGDRLPTIRALASALGISPSTVSEAWRFLAQHGLVTTARRNGTVVRPAAAMTGRFWKVPATSADIVDLSTGTPDTDFLPSVQSTIQALPTNIAITSYMDRPVLEELDETLRARWPFVPEAMTVVDGALDAVDRLIEAMVSLGDTVIVEDPTFPPILDMLERAGARVIGIELDGSGIRPDQLERALRELPAMAIVQPVAHNPTGCSMTPERAVRVAAAFERESPNTWIVEDHHAGDLIQHGGVSLGCHLPERVIRVHSFSKSHGPDLRIAAIGGAAEPIQRVVDRRRLGPSWTSRLIQHMLLALLRDNETDRLVESAQIDYAARRSELSQLLQQAGIDIGHGEGLNMWIPVADESRAVVALALRGIGVAAGTPFAVNPAVCPNHIRVSVGNARSDLPRIAEAIAEATRA
jgi:DNA-binding transcriptional MocR family regulator